MFDREETLCIVQIYLKISVNDEGRSQRHQNWKKNMAAHLAKKVVAANPTLKTEKAGDA